METYANQPKSSSSFSNAAIPGKWKWSDPNALWSDAGFTWSGLRTVNWTDLAKPVSTSFVTTNPFFGWLFYFTQPTGTTTGTQWINQNKQ